jgi:electron transfer flavoprotein alpha subunit
MKDYKGVMVFAEQEDGKIHPVTFELLGKGRELADKLNVELSSVLLGHNIEKEAKELIYHGADKVFLFEHESLKEFDVIKYKENIVNLLKEVKPEIFLVGATKVGRTLAPRIAASLETGLTADCTDLDLDEEGNLIQIRPAFSGNIMAKIRTRTRPQMATVRYKIMKKLDRDEGRKGEIVRKKVRLVENSGIKIVSKELSKEIDISEAEVIVSCGRGLRSPEDFRTFEELANLLGGAVGSSRPLVDEGWISKEHQVGFSGNIVKPKVYIACGISGSPQHLFGMRDSELIIAINKDPSAPIFSVADYGLIGDIYEIMPLLIKKIKEWREKGCGD